jgi:hypothetical protein
LVNHSLTFGDKVGWITIDYDTYTVPDRIDVRYNNKWVASTGSVLSGNSPPTKLCSSVTAGDGFIGAKGSFKIFYDGKVSKKLDIYVSGCLEGGTLWEFKVRECPTTWYTGLPDCPCRYNPNIDGTNESGGTWKDFSNGCFGFFEYLDVYHYGAKYELRWAENGDVPGQQCTYDVDKNLITGGIAAGTPDKFGATSPCIPNSKHQSADVDPWKVIPCWQYLRDWPSNKGLACSLPNNKVSSMDHMTKMIGNMTCEEATLLIRRAKESPNLLIDGQLRDYISGVPVSLTNAQLISKLQNWKDLNSCGLFPTDALCVVISKAIANLQ